MLELAGLLLFEKLNFSVTMTRFLGAVSKRLLFKLLLFVELELGLDNGTFGVLLSFDVLKLVLLVELVKLSTL